MINKQLSKYLGIDFGMKKSGVSISDSNKLISFPLETIETKNLLNFIKQISINENIEIVVIGKPLKLNNEIHDFEEEIVKFIKKLKIQLPSIQVERIDERFSSNISKQIILKSGLRKKKRREKFLIDKISASLILESYLIQNNK
ncbi:MAG: Holliday junction resolvase RuvX [Bacteroidetes bacterium]|nr:Holliday junction resolvase RuvX [Cryomorphaceae bacterium]MBL6677471.1 Holliday junction resolvase RuvX [Flavobacteriaceae bacterium]MDA0331323.1 Holliday junction resolvase RuvX [Bacteroidota bacterium]MDA0885687.1 Holliday junction resolvase RuvX [Bacteroidota bacterium]MDA1226078.1 Holliday junction resolvase RuvX [Bacteroidota bacterium]